MSGRTRLCEVARHHREIDGNFREIAGIIREVTCRALDFVRSRRSITVHHADPSQCGKHDGAHIFLLFFLGTYQKRRDIDSRFIAVDPPSVLSSDFAPVLTIPSTAFQCSLP